MLHSIDGDKHPRGDAMAKAVQTCVHCGFCLPTCPTYSVLGQEMDSPRGRIFLMKEVLEGKLESSEAQSHIDRCLGCLACETHCPSGVKYGDLISPFRAAESSKNETLHARIRRNLTLLCLPYPGRFRLAMWTGKLAKRITWLVPRFLRPMIDLVPESLPKRIALPSVTHAEGTVRGRVALLAGCAQQVLDPEINMSTIRVLARNGFEVVVPKKQSCCGALAWHVGDAQRAEKFAIRNLAAFDVEQFDAIVTNAAGCGSGLHEYPLILDGSPYEGPARNLAKKTVDVSKILASDPLSPIPNPARTIRIAYHDACHLGHAQRVRSEPRHLLKQIPGAELLEIQDSDICCGSAGTYNIDQPEIAEELGQAKAQRIRDTRCDVVALGNIGCKMQIEKYLRELGCNVPVLHTMQILDLAYSQKLRSL